MSSRQQRVTVKIHLVRHQSSQRGQASVSRHVHYLKRDGVTRDGEPAKFYDLEQEGINPRGLSREWVDDRHHFRIIVSPERGESIPCMQTYTRDVMRRVEVDLGAKIEWVAVDHYNTSHPHSHVLIRGRSEDRDLVIDRAYLSHGIRERAADVATATLGKRTKTHAKEAYRKQVYAERWTELDRLIERLANQQGNSRCLNLSEVKLRPGVVFSVRIIAQRLEVLRGLGLVSAEPTTKEKLMQKLSRTPRRWVIHHDCQDALKELGERNDVIKQIHLVMSGNARSVVPHIERFRSAPYPVGTDGQEPGDQ